MCRLELALTLEVQVLVDVPDLPASVATSAAFGAAVGATEAFSGTLFAGVAAPCVRTDDVMKVVDHAASQVGAGVAMQLPSTVSNDICRG